MRLADAGMGDQMVEYCLYGVLHFHRDMDHYRRDQAEGGWTPRPFVAASQRRVGVLGLGTLGAQVADAASAFGFDTAGWSRSPKVLRKVRTFSGIDQFDAFLARTDILVNLLPLTNETRGILNAETLRKLPRGACLINAARGAHVVESDLLNALDKGHIRGCLLDAFDPEPLPADHPFRRHPGVMVTPHVAAQTIPREACYQIVNNIKRLEDGRRRSMWLTAPTDTRRAPPDIGHVGGPTPLRRGPIGWIRIVQGAQTTYACACGPHPGVPFPVNGYLARRVCGSGWLLHHDRSGRRRR